MPSKTQKLLLYGCTGYIGRLTSQRVSSHPILKGNVVLAGRSRKKVEDVACVLRLPYKVFDLKSDVVIDDNLKDIGVVLNMAGPFYQTARPLLASCLRTKTNYLDVTGEFNIFRLLFETFRPAIQNAGIIAVPGVGFDIVPTDCLAAMLRNQLPTATHLDLCSSFSDLQRPTAASPGNIKAAIHTIAASEPTALSRVDGVVCHTPAFTKTRFVDFPNAGHTSVGFVPWGGCYTAYYSTDIPNIHTYVPVDPNLSSRTAPLSLFLLHLIHFFLEWVPLVEWFLFALVDQFAPRPSEKQRLNTRIDVWGEARDERTGECVQGCLQTMDAYGFASIAALEAASQVLVRGKDADLAPGVHTPSQAFSPEFVFVVPDTTLYEFIRLPAKEKATEGSTVMAIPSVVGQRI